MQPFKVQTPRQNLPTVGDVLGQMTLIAPAPSRVGGRRRWLCRCVCGAEKVVGQTQLRNGNTQSCGCLARQRASEANMTHGLYKNYLYKLWENIISRCFNSRHDSYANYGARGIKLWAPWRESFEAFRDGILTEIGERPSAGHSLDRPVNSADYCPGNIRWALPSVQGRNKRTNKLITADGKTLCLAEWVEVSGIGRDTINRRIRELGWTEERAVTQPLRPRRI